MINCKRFIKKSLIIISMTSEAQPELERIDSKLLYASFQSLKFLKKLCSCINGTEKRRRERGFIGYKIVGNPQIHMTPIIEGTSERIYFIDYFHGGSDIYDIFFLHTHPPKENGVPSPEDIGLLSLAQACCAKERSGVRPIGIVASYANPPYISLALHQIKEGLDPTDILVEAKKLANDEQNNITDKDNYGSLLNYLNICGIFFNPASGSFNKKAINSFDIKNHQADKLETVLEKFSFEVPHQKQSHN